MLKAFKSNEKLQINTNVKRNPLIQSNKSVGSVMSFGSLKSNSSMNSIQSSPPHSLNSSNSLSSTNSVDYKVKASKNYMSPLENSTLIPNYGKLRFLIVDDNLINLKILYKILSKIFPNAQIVKLTNSSTVMKLLETERFDLVFLDIEMPPISGIEISKRIRSHQRFNKLGIIAVTTRSNEKDLRLYKKIGIDYTFRKPLNYGLTIVLNHIELVINHRKNK